MAEAAGACRVRSRAGRTALSRSRSFPTSGRGHLGTALECGPASMRGTPKTSRRVSASRSTGRYPGAEGKILALARDLPRLWHAPTTQAKDRKRLLRLLIKDITV